MGRLKEGEEVLALHCLHSEQNTALDRSLNSYLWENM